MAELFANFEVNREPRWPVISKLLAGSLALHVLLALLRGLHSRRPSCVQSRQLDRRHQFCRQGLRTNRNWRRSSIGRTDAREVSLPGGYFAPEGQAGSRASAGADSVRRSSLKRSRPACNRTCGYTVAESIADCLARLVSFAESGRKRFARSHERDQATKSKTNVRVRVPVSRVRR